MRGKRQENWWHSQEGAVAVEFALIILILAFLLGATVDFGHYLFLRNLAINASREGARYGAIYTEPKITADQIKSFIVQKYGAALGITASDITVSGAGGASGNDLTVTVTANKQWFFLDSLINQLPVANALKRPTGVTVMKLE